MNKARSLPKPIIAAIAVACLAVAGFFMLRGGEPQMSGEPTTETLTEDRGEGLPDYVLGAADAPVTIVEYASFTCPHCANFHTDVFPKIKAEYIDEGHVKFVYREVYFDKFGLWAGMLARCGGEDRYFGIVDLLYKKQSEWARGESEAEIANNLYKIGRQAGLEQEAMEACLANDDQAQALVADFQLKAGADDISSTPSFIIDGASMGNMPFSDFQEIIDGKLN